MKKPIIAIMENGSPITVGMHCSSGFNGDSDPFEVVSIDSPSKITVRAMSHRPNPDSKDPPSVCFAENPDNFIYTSNPDGGLYTVKRHRKLGRDKKTWLYSWRIENGFKMYFGKACFTRNPHF